MIWPPRTSLPIRALAALLALAGSDRVFAQTTRADFPVTNGAANVQLLSGGTLYVGGSFGYVGAQSGGGVPVDSVTGTPVAGYAKVNGIVSAIAPDGAGGWFIGGLFNSVNGISRNNLAHVLADNSVASWNPGADAQVFALAEGGGVVYAGGAFASAGGASRARLAAIDSAGGSATAWNPGANDIVRALALHGATLYVVGRFTVSGGQTRNRAAAFDTASAAATSWDPGVGSEVLAVASGPGSVYLGGTFTSIGSKSRNRIAEVDSATGLVTNWNPNANAQVAALALGDGTIYLGGSFTTLGGATHQRIGEVSLTTGSGTSWAPNANAAVSAIALSDDFVYAGGDFTTIAGQSRSRIAELDRNTGAATAWNPIAFGSVLALSPNGLGAVFAGGSFGAIGGSARNNVAALDAVTGAILPWNPGTDGQVLALSTRGGVLYIGGQFATVAGQPRANAAAVDAQTGALRPWDPSPSDLVTTLAPNDTSVYLGGLFATVGGQARNFVGQVDASGGAALPWNPSPDGEVFEIRLAGGLVYLGGSFSSVGGQDRSDLAAIDPVTAAATAWDPSPNGTVRALVPSCDKLYAAGFFTTIGGQVRNRIAALDVGSGSATSWNPNANGQIFDLEVADGVLYAGGLFSVIGGQNRLRVAALDLTTGLATPWNPSCTGTVRALSAGNDQVFVGGTITAMGLTNLANLAAVSSDATYGCPLVTITPASLPDGVAGVAYSQTLSASAGTAPRCWALTDGVLPPGLSLSSSGVLSGTPTSTASSSFTVTATDARGCTASRTLSLTTFGEAITAGIAPNAAGLCVNPAHPFVTVPLVYTRTDSTPARLVSVTFHLDTSRLVLHTPGSPGASVHLGSWFNAYAGAFLQVTDNGGGTYTADATLLGSPCGPISGGQVLTVDVAAAGPDGFGSVAVTAVHVRDCDNQPIASAPGSPDSVRIQFTPLAIAPTSLPTATVGTNYHQVLTPSGGTAPYVFALLSGTLPAGVTLSAAGVLDGVPTAAVLDTFTVGVTDSFACAGQRTYILNVTCPAMAISPADLPDGLVGSAYSVALSASGATAPLAWSVSAGALPDGLSIDAVTGAITGTPTAPGTSTLTVSFTEAHACGTSRNYVFTLFTPPVNSTLAANPAGLCLSTAHTSVAVPFVLTRTDTVRARRLRVTFQLDATRIALATPAAPESSLHAGTWFTGFLAPTIVASNAGAGAWTVDLALPPGPCGPDSGGIAFTADVVATGLDGAAAITVQSVKLIGCPGDTLPVLPGAPASLTVNRSAPAAVAGLAAAPVTSGNGAGSTTGITLTWTAGSQPVSLYRAPWASYPTFTATAPPDSALAPGAPWTLVAGGATSPYVDHPGVRGFWYYVALSSDSCGNLSPVSVRTTGTLDYLAGDVSNGTTPGTGNNVVGLEDVTLLGVNYGISGGTISSRGVQYLDVGPTTDLAITSRPVPDGQLDFDDLMIFATNFQQAVTAPAAAALPAHPLSAVATPERFRIEAPALVSAGQELAVPLRLEAGGRMQGLSVQLAWDPEVLAPLTVTPGGFAEGQGGVVLSPGPGRVDAALLGRREVGLTGDGTVATFGFRALRAGDPLLRISAVRGRDAANRPLSADVLTLASVDELPHQTLLLAPTPNPFTSSVALHFSLAQAGNAELAIYDLVGRRVRTLANGRLEAGVHHYAWDGRDDSRAPSAPGVYFVRFVADGHRFTSRLVHLK